MKMARIKTVLYSCDLKFFEPLKASIRSLVKNWKGDLLELIIVSNDLGPDEMAELSLANPDPWLSFQLISFDVPLSREAVLYRGGHIQSLSTFARIYMGEYLPHHVEDLLYLDCDTLVRADLSQLWEMDFQGKAVLAVSDICFYFRFSPLAKLGIEGFSELAELPYFNAGMMRVDLKRWRELGIQNKALELIARFGPQLRNFDQDALNWALRGQWQEISHRWNYLYMISFFPDLSIHQNLKNEFKSWKDNPAIVHFIYKIKPWDLDYYGPFKAEYLANWSLCNDESKNVTLKTATGIKSWVKSRILIWDSFEFGSMLFNARLNHRQNGKFVRSGIVLAGYLLKKPWQLLLFPVGRLLGWRSARKDVSALPRSMKQPAI